MLNKLVLGGLEFNKNQNIYRIPAVRYLLFFFKFIKLRKVFKLKDLFWRYNLTSIRKKEYIGVNKWLWSLNKKKKYKPYSFFKFNIYKYRRVFNPKYWYNFNTYLLTRYNYIYFKLPCVDWSNDARRFISTFSYGTCYPGLTVRKQFDLWTLCWGGLNITQLQFKSKRFPHQNLQKVLTSAQQGNEWSKLPALSKFLPWWKYKRQLSAKQLTYQSIRNNKPVEMVNPRVSIVVKHNRDLRKMQIKKAEVFVKTQTKLKLPVMWKQRNWLTGYFYQAGQHQKQRHVDILTLKILFNSYNYKTYNWRVLN